MLENGVVEMQQFCLQLMNGCALIICKSLKPFNKGHIDWSWFHPLQQHAENG